MEKRRPINCNNKANKKLAKKKLTKIRHITVPYILHVISLSYMSYNGNSRHNF